MADVNFAKAGKHFNKIKELTKQIDQTQNLKASSDLSNRILIEILTAQREMVILLANISREQSSKNYIGVDSKEKPEVEKKEPWESYEDYVYSAGDNPFFDDNVCSQLMKANKDC